MSFPLSPALPPFFLSLIFLEIIRPFRSALFCQFRHRLVAASSDLTPVLHAIASSEIIAVSAWLCFVNSPESFHSSRPRDAETSSRPRPSAHFAMTGFRQAYSSALVGAPSALRAQQSPDRHARFR
jgi:hypothetical protein